MFTKPFEPKGFLKDVAIRVSGFDRLDILSPSRLPGSGVFESESDSLAGSGNYRHLCFSGSGGSLGMASPAPHRLICQLFTVAHRLPKQS